MMQKDFEWGQANDWFKQTISQEICQNRIYEKLYPVEDGDVVVDFGASIGPFMYSLIDKNVKHMYCIEPSPQEFETLLANSKHVMFPVTCINKGVGAKSGMAELELWGTYKDQGIQPFEMGMAPVISFKDFLKEHNIEKIDFLKTDCEGGEYDIFNVENFSWINGNVKKIVGEWHLQTPEMVKKFVKFKDLYLRNFDKFEVQSVDGFNITHHLHTDWFISYFKQVIIHIDNSQNVISE